MSTVQDDLDRGIQAAIHVAANPYPWPLRRRSAGQQHGPDRDRHANRFLRQGRLRRQNGLRSVAHPSADRTDPATPRRHARAGLHDHSHARRAPARSVGPAGQQALAKRNTSAPGSAIRGHADESWCAASRVGTSFPSWLPSRANRLSTSPARARFTPPISSCCCIAAGSKHNSQRHYDRRLRTHDDARRQRSRFRMSCCWKIAAAQPTWATIGRPSK